VVINHTQTRFVCKPCAIALSDKSRARPKTAVMPPVDASAAAADDVAPVAASKPSARPKTSVMAPLDAAAAAVAAAKPDARPKTTVMQPLDAATAAAMGVATEKRVSPFRNVPLRAVSVLMSPAESDAHAAQMAAMRSHAGSSPPLLKARALSRVRQC
jgi:hypothetical protein